MSDDGVRTDGAGFRLRGLETTRIETFTDAAFAFALTLLVLFGNDLPRTLEDIRGSLRMIPSFVMSGALLMTFWWGHHVWSRRYGLDDGATTVLSCLLVFTVLVYVYPLRFMTEVFVTWMGQALSLPIGRSTYQVTPEQIPGIFVIYGAGFIAMCLALMLLNLHAWRRREVLALDEGERRATLAGVQSWAIMASTGVLSVLLALMLPLEPWSIGIPGWTYALPAVLMPLHSRMTNRRTTPVDPVRGAMEPEHTNIERDRPAMTQETR